jgi:hypothetical protein
MDYPIHEVFFTLKRKIEKIFSLLVAKSILATTIRALPGDIVAGHPPKIFIHTHLTNMKTAAAAPTKGRIFSTTMTLF